MSVKSVPKVMNDWSSQSSVGSSSSGSWSRSRVVVSNGVNTGSDCFNTNAFRQTIECFERELSEHISNVSNDLNLDKCFDPQKQQHVLHAFRQLLGKAREVRDEFEALMRLRNALTKMIKISKRRDECVHEWRENSKQLLSIERHLHSILGHFEFTVEAIEGWARICARDQYELEFRYGQKQRHCVKVRVGTDVSDRQYVDSEFAFKTLISEAVVLRMREVKTGWTKRHVTLGVTQLETRDLIKCRTQQLTVLGNTSGSLKVRLKVKWRPLLGEMSDRDSEVKGSDESLDEKREPVIDQSEEELAEVIHSLTTALEDFRGQFEELVPMHSAVERLCQLLTTGQCSGQYSDQRDTKESDSENDDIAMALAEFGFLEENSEQTNTVISKNPKNSHFSSQWSLCVVTHARDALTQLSHVGTWVLKARECDALKRLADDALALLELSLHHNCHDFRQFISGDDARVGQLWAQLLHFCQNNYNNNNANNGLIVWKHFSDFISFSMKSKIVKNLENISEENILISAQFLASKISETDFITVFHLNSFWKRFSPKITFEEILRLCLDSNLLILAQNPQQFETLLSRFIAREWTPREVTWSAARAMISAEKEMSEIAVQWIEIMKNDDKTDISTHLMSGLESFSVNTRRACCHVLAHLKDDNAVDALLHVSTDDPDARVRESARQSLLLFGSEVMSRWQQCSLTQMGFSGIVINSNNNNNNNNL